MRLLGFSNREVERRMGLNQGLVSRVLSGQIEAKMALVLGVARSTGLEYDELFAFAYPEPRSAAQESAAAKSVRSLLEDILPSAGRLGRPVPAPARTLPVPYQFTRSRRRSRCDGPGELAGGGRGRCEEELRLRRTRALCNGLIQFRHGDRLLALERGSALVADGAGVFQDRHDGTPVLSSPSCEPNRC